jgi:DNA-binding winged helix-turn-helix (wHTH) protein/TolB-like protein/Tfp pilus assembly protein PilF
MDKGPAAYQFGHFRVETRSRRLIRGDQALPLTPKVFDTLLYLIEHRGSVVTKDRMLAALWPDVTVEENNLGQAISKLRHALGEAPGDNAYIATVPGHGYRFVAEVVETPTVDQRSDLASSADRAPAGDVPEPRPYRSASAAAVSAGESERLSRRAILRVVAGLLVVAVGAALTYVSLGRRSAGARVRIASIAVLPFKPLAPQDRNEALEFGVADTLISRLGTLGDVRVQSLGTVRRYAGASTNPVDAGRELGVDAVLDGHIQRVGDRIRITARLVRIADQRQVWTGKYDEDFGHVFEIQDTIARRVAEELAPELDDSARRRVTKRETDDAAAYELYLKGRFFMTLAQPQNAIRMFEEAVSRDPGFAAAHAGLADIYSRLPIASDGPSGDAMARAEAAANRALAIDPNLAAAHTARGWIAYYHGWDWAESEKSFEKALQLKPADFSARIGLGHLLSTTYRHDAALVQIDHALSVEPMSPIAATLKAQFLFYAQRYDESRDQVRKTLLAAPNFWIAQINLGRLHLRERNFPEALAAFTRARQSGGTYNPLSLIGYTEAMAGRSAASTSVLRELMNASKQAYVPPYHIALVHQAIGNQGDALDWLERAYAERDVHIVFIGVDPLWDGLRGHPRFADLLKRMRLAK